MDHSRNDDKYVLLKRLENSPLTQLILSKFRTEEIDFRVHNDNISSVYPLATLDMTLEVKQKDLNNAKRIIDELEQSHVVQNTNTDFKEASLEDIEFEKAIYEKDKEITEAQPPYLIFLLILIMIGLTFYFVAF